LPSHRGDFDWWKCISRSTLFSLKKIQKAWEEWRKIGSYSRKNMDERERSRKQPLGTKDAFYSLPTTYGRCVLGRPKIFVQLTLEIPLRPKSLPPKQKFRTTQETQVPMVQPADMVFKLT
jgi:hypothetical protein